MKIYRNQSATDKSKLLAQAAGGLADGASKAMGIVMLFGFIFGTVAVIGGGFAIRRGDADAGEMSIIAGAPVIVKALFTAFGLGGSTVRCRCFSITYESRT